MQLAGVNNEKYSYTHYNGTDTDTLSLHGRTQHTFNINNAEAMRIDSSGNVGIGTSSPAGKLHINTDATASLASATINEVSDFSVSSRVGFSGLSNNSDGMYFGTGVDGGVSAGMGFFREVSGWDTAIAFYTNNQTSGTYGVDAIQEAMRITSAGDVGIGTATPAAKLDVNGTLACDGFTSTGIDDNATSTAITIGANEAVGIGTDTDFGGALNVNGGLNSKQAVFTSTNNRGLALSTATRSGQNDGVAIIDAQDTESTGGRLELHTMGVARASFERDQIVFNDGSLDQDFRVESANNANMLFVDAGNDKIGVGTGSPNRSFQVHNSLSANIVNFHYLNVVSAYKISSGTANRNVRVEFGDGGEYWLKMHIVGLWPYTGSGYGTVTIEVAGYGSEERFTVIETTKTAGGASVTATVSADNNALNIAISSSYGSWRWSVMTEMVLGPSGAYVSVDGTDG
jgi:hypothetical protein